MQRIPNRHAGRSPLLTSKRIRLTLGPHQVLFGVPMRIDWEKLDSNLLEAYFNSIDEPDVPPPPPFARNVLPLPSPSPARVVYR